MHSRHVVLIGEMGAGKTTVGRMLADRLGWGFFDSDLWIEDTHGRTGAEIATGDGVTFLHRVELAALEAGLATADTSVIAAAASVADTSLGQEMLGSVTLVWLDASESVLAGRRRVGSHRRTQNEDERKRTRLQRHATWADLATIRVDVSDAAPDEIVTEILARLERSGA